MTAAVTVEGISKRYTLGLGGGYRRLTEVVTDRFRSVGRGTASREELWALKDVSFEVGEGEVIGIIGRNGAGKSTLLKILSRITEPTSGRAVLHGRVGSLLEVGTGFHPELTGRENIFLNGAVLGMRKAEIARQFDEIVAFAEIDRFLDTPVKRYSSGMYVRLAFAVAAYLEPEILIVDEVLAVGDATFQKKCLGKMGDVAQSGRTVLFVSHNMAAVKALCSRGLVIEHGSVSCDGTVDKAIDEYLRSAQDLTLVDLADRRDRRGTGRVRLTSLEVRSAGVRGTGLVFGQPGEIHLGFEADAVGGVVQVSLGLFSSTGEGAAFLGTEVAGKSVEGLPTRGALVCTLPKVPLLPGSYSVNVYVTSGGEVADWVQDAATVEVQEGDYFGSGKLPLPGYGFVAVPHEWEVAAE